LSANRYILTTGGTGGHIFPAIAVARAIQKLEPEADILFVGAKGGMEEKMVSQAGFSILSVTISGFARKLNLKNLYKNLLFPLKYVLGLWQASRILGIFQPQVVVGFGGFASAPTLRMALSKNIPSVIHESNAYPGVVNRMVANRVRKVFIGNEKVKSYLSSSNIYFTGNPIREQLLNGSREKGLDTWNFTPDQKIVLIIGGSRGARTINEAVLAGLDKLIASKIQILWQCGTIYFEEFQSRISHHSQVRLMPFIENMGDAYACADLVVSRAGAMSIAEITALRKPSILIPSPNVAEDHQTQNARSLTEKGAAILVTDARAKEDLAPTIIEFLGATEKYSNMKLALETYPLSDAASIIASEIISIANERRGHV